MFDEPVFQSVHDPKDPTAPPRGGRKGSLLSKRLIVWSVIAMSALGSCLICAAVAQASSVKPTETPTITTTLPAPVVKSNNDSLVGTSVARTLQAIQPGAPSATPSPTNALLVGDGTKLSPQTVLTVMLANQSPSPTRTPTNTAQSQTQQPQAPIVLIATNTKAPIIVTATPTATDKVVVITTTPGPTQTPYIIVQSPTPQATQTPWLVLNSASLTPIMTVISYQTVIFYQTVIVTATPTITPTPSNTPTVTATATNTPTGTPTP